MVFSRLRIRSLELKGELRVNVRVMYVFELQFYRGSSGQHGHGKSTTFDSIVVSIACAWVTGLAKKGGFSGFWLQSHEVQLGPYISSSQRQAAPETMLLVTLLSEFWSTRGRGPRLHSLFFST